MGAPSYNYKEMKDPKKFTRAELRYLFRKICSRIRQKPRGYFILSKLRGACGYCIYDESIQIDYRKLIVPTIIHEVLHDMYPGQWEGWVLRLESKLVNILRTSDIIQLMTLFFSKLQKPKKRRAARRRKKVKSQKQTR